MTFSKVDFTVEGLREILRSSRKSRSLEFFLGKKYLSLSGLRVSQLKSSLQEPLLVLGREIQCRMG